ncbi:hypothetical protein [Nocardiopsis sp. NPDC057823]|uniref:hypothetical protein n=1 Tax=Nocardiopsis sp. NPDC057823 TaxID=3346256 RepID=UPI0036700556
MGIEDALTALLQGRWTLTTETDDDGVAKIVAYRPVGWTGPGDPHERLEADDTQGMWSLLVRREDLDAPEPPRPEVSRMRGIGKDLPGLGWAVGD